MGVFERVIEAVLPSQELMQMERAYILRTGHCPTNQQKKRWKRDIKRDATPR